MSAERYLRWDHRGPRSRQQSLLWPVEVWTILAPDATRRLNVFQEAILGLLQTGIRDRQQLAKLLGLEESLITFVLAHEIMPAGWVDGQFRLTPAGEDLLSGGIDTQGAPSLQYAYRDSVFGRWLPRVSRDLPDVYPLEMGAQRFPAFRDSREGGGEVRPFLLPRRQDVSTPAKADILKAWRAGLRDALRADGDEEGVPEIRSDDIEILGNEPTLAYVWCEVIHVPGDLHPWLVTDPWRITPVARWLREPLQASLDSMPTLERRISAVLPAADASVLSADALSRQIERDVEMRLSRWPALDVPGLSELKHHVGRVMRQKARTETLEKATQEELASLVQECGSLLEALVQWMLENWPVGEIVWPRDGQNRGAAEAMLDAVPLRAPLPERSRGMLAGQNFRDVRLAARSRDRPFKALLFAALLSTHAHPDHPLRELDDAQVQWERLLDLIGMRNKGAHASGRRLQRGDALSEAGFAIGWFENFSKYF
ncbi:hypothetical protein HHL11_30065 [Ramlibacter sp. G-1-2-2]|uniref:Uncharacterized protein n=1 Tax=Ramlibacter agri TaxID=2728837 RepID=A0A848HD05_9BURK|nr:hypothetical protein [Ramlibacter agri]NML48032.1 hypothetical protein [Ramlibacter agri]